MKVVYVVIGTAGEYSDRMEWTVCAYRDKSKAETHATLAERWIAETRERIAALEWRLRHEAWKANPYDANCQYDYARTDYTVAEVPMLRDLPQSEVKG
jgi:hypothetical protein